MDLRISKLHKNFGQTEVLRGIDINVPTGAVVGLIGSSGAGKSTLLRCIDFLESPDSGELVIGNHAPIDMGAPDKSDVEFVRRSTSMVFQSFNLYKYKTVLENIELALLKVQRKDKREAREISLELLSRVGLYEKRDAFPRTLSGGQQQRVSLVRAAALRPKVMLLDEPTSALDPENVGEVLTVIRDFAEQGQSMIIASHEMNFLRQIVDYVYFMDKGIVEEEGAHVLDNPQHERTQRFLDRAYGTDGEK